jgi:hypothetical protein
MNKFYIPLFAVLFFAQNLAAQTDTVPPVLICIGTKSIPMAYPCVTTVWANDLVISVTDDAPGPIRLGIRKQCTGSGFPENKPSVVYSSYEQGTMVAEVWAMDGAGNTSSCLVRLNIYDFGNCDPAETVILKTPALQGIGGVSVGMRGENCVGDTLWTFSTPHYISSADGWWSLGGG